MSQQFNKANGTQTAVIGTEHTLDAETTAGVYTITVNLKNMVNGDILQLRVYKKVLTGDAQSWLMYEAEYSNLQGDAAAVGSKANGEVLVISPAIVGAFGCTFTLLQTAGTGRAFPWVVDQLS